MIWGLILIKNVINGGGLMVWKHPCIPFIIPNIFIFAGEYILGQAANTLTKNDFLICIFV